jgi:methyl-accepting chemotaxis protein
MVRTWKRRNYFIKKDLQGKYIFSFFLFVITGSIVFTLIFSLLSADTLTVVYENNTLQIGKTPLILLKEILSAHWIFIVACGFFVVILAMFLTHRLAGPIYRFERSVDELIKGNFAFQIHLRTKDEGKELAEKINELITVIASDVREMKHITLEMDRKLSEAYSAVKLSEKDKETAVDLEIASDLNRRLHDILQKFLIKDDI